MRQLNFTRTEFDDVIRIKPFLTSDERGGVIKIYAIDQFKEYGIDFFPNEETFLKSRRGVLRGLHYQDTMLQSKLITCIDGRVQFVAVNMDRNGSCYGKWMSVNLEPRDVIYVPGHYAIGTLALVDTTLHLGYGERFISECSAGIRWDDPDLQIDWLLQETGESPIVAEKDRCLPMFAEFKMDYK